MILYRCNTRGDCYVFKKFTITERTTTYIRNALGDYYTCEIYAPIKSIFSYACNSTLNYYTCNLEVVIVPRFIVVVVVIHIACACDGENTICEVPSCVVATLAKFCRGDICKFVPARCCGISSFCRIGHIERASTLINAPEYIAVYCKEILGGDE